MPMTSILSPFRSLARELRRNPGFLLVAVLTLAVGIRANAAIFSVVNAVLIRPLPYPEPERLVGVWHSAPGLHMDQVEFSDGSYVLYRKANRVLEDLGIYTDGSVTSVFRVQPVVGRTIQEEDGRPGADQVAVLSHALWRHRFGGDPRAVGR